MTTDEALALIPPTFLVNNLFQYDDGSWQANIRSGDLCYEYGKGRTPAAAICAAILTTAKTGTPSIKNAARIAATPSTTRPKTKGLSLEDLGL